MLNEQINELKNKMRLSIQEYSDRIRDLDNIRKKIEIGGVETEDIVRLCDLSTQALLNSQIVALDRVYPSLDILPASCPTCKQPIFVMKVGAGKAWACSACGTSSNKNYREPKVTGESLPKERNTAIVESILLMLQRKKKVI